MKDRMALTAAHLTIRAMSPINPKTEEKRNKQWCTGYRAQAHGNEKQTHEQQEKQYNITMVT